MAFVCRQPYIFCLCRKVGTQQAAYQTSAKSKIWDVCVKEHATQKEGMARLGLHKAEILLKPTINEVDFRLHEFKLHLPNLALTSLLSPWGLNYPRWQMMNLECEMKNEE